MRYRPEIDGLRAISVLAVLLYHCALELGGVRLLPGGYLGVDVFFVISGYLITGLLLEEYSATGSVSIAAFYQRRVRRLAPALLLVLLVSAFAAWFILLPTALVEFSHSLLASLFFVSNFYWSEALQEYGAAPALYQPLLHTWSLAVEEQFYLLFPAFLLLLHRKFSHRLLPIMLALAGVGALYAEFATSIDQAYSFYLLPARLWELLAGAAVARLPVIRNAAYAQILALLGLGAVLYSFLMIGFGPFHPGLITLPTVLGTCLLLACASPATWVGRCLASRSFVLIGLISYSLYLWHYPIFAFGRILQPEPTVVARLFWIAISFACAAASYRWVEQPARNRRRLRFRKLLPLLAGAALLLIAYCSSAILSSGAPQRFAKLQAIYGANEMDNQRLQALSWMPLNRLAEARAMEVSHPSAPSPFESMVDWYPGHPSRGRVLIVGNSHSKDLFNAFYLNNELFAGYRFARFGMNNRLDEFQLLQLLKSPNLAASDTVILSFFASRESLEELPGLIATLQQAGKRVMLASNTPAFLGRGQMPLFDWSLRRAGSASDFSTAELNSMFYERIKADELFAINADLEALAGSYDLRWLDKLRLVCEPVDEMCFGVTPEGKKTFFDQHHWTIEGAMLFGQRAHAQDWLPSLPQPTGQ